ncbi:MAG TPA: hypothetical protein VGD40_09415 [Chryseosolibacter sp.]
MPKILNATALLNALLPPLAIAAAITGFLVLNEEVLSTFAITWISIGYIWSTHWLFGALNKTYDLFYDDKFVYLKGCFRKRKIAFRHVTRIQLTSHRRRILGFSTWKYRIVFASEVGIDDQYFWDVMGGKAADEFGAAVKAQNDAVKIVHHT